MTYVAHIGNGLVVLESKGDPPRAQAAINAITASAERRRARQPPVTPLDDAVASAQVDFAEEDFIVQAEAMPTECSLANGCPGLWGMNAIRAPQAWSQIATAVAPSSVSKMGSVIDTGVQYENVELTGQFVRSLGITYYNNTITGDGSDDNGHGTHCGGSVAARWGDEALGGIAGVVGQPNSLMACKFLNVNGTGFTSDGISCVNRVVASNAHAVISNSWSGGGFSQALLTAIRAVCSAGGLFVAAAGNSAVDISAGNGTYPAYYSVSPGAECVLPVAAVDQTLTLGSFSNYGASVPIAAPGVAILSSYLTAGTTTGTATLTGTSMAAPHVSGVALLLRNSFPLLTGMQVKNLLVSSAAKVVTSRPAPAA